MYLLKNIAVGPMAGRFVKFGSAIVLLCALILRVAEAAAGHENTNDEDFGGGTHGDTSLFL